MTVGLVIAVIPLVAFVILRTLCTRYFYEGRYFRFAMPESWLIIALGCFQLWSVVTLGYTLVEYVLFVYCIVGLAIVLYVYRRNRRPVAWYRFLKKYIEGIYIVTAIVYLIWLAFVMITTIF